jgi:hypothetical protein
MHGLQNEFIDCPYCGEQIEIVIDCSIEEQDFIEDCSVCCQPIVLSVVICGEEDIHIIARRHDE